MKINGLRLSFISIESFMQPLRSLSPPPIPFSFLLSGPLFEGKMGQSLEGLGPFDVPIRGAYGKLFWSKLGAVSGRFNQMNGRRGRLFEKIGRGERILNL